MIDRVLEVANSFDAAAKADREFWWSQSPADRLTHALQLRRLNYGTDRVSERLQRVLEITQRTANKRASGRSKDLDDLDNLPQSPMN